MNPSMTIPAPDALLEHQAFLRALARSLLHDEQAADDVVQETYLKALDGVPRHGNLRGWLARVTRNFALNALRSDRRRARREQVAARGESLPSVEEGVARLEVQRNVVDAVLALDEPYRSVIVHRFFYELELKEIARRLDLPLETVRTRLRRALARLRESMDARHHGDRRAWSVALLPLAWPAHASAAAVTTGGGVLLMSLKAKLAIAALILIALGVLGFQFTRPETLPNRAREAEATTTPPVNEPATDATSGDSRSASVRAVDRDLDLHGIVVDAAGKPVAGARLQSVRYPNVRAHELGAQSHRPVLGPRTISDAGGEFRLRLARGQEVALRVRAEGFATVERREIQAGARVRIELRPGVDLPLQVRDGSGRPLAGAIVFLQAADSDRSEVSDFFFGIRGETDGEGRFVARGLLPSSERTVIVMHPDFAMNMITIESLEESIAEDTTIDLPEADPVKGIVVDRESGRPVEGAILSAFPMAYGKTAVSGADGRFEYKGWSLEGQFSGALHVLTGSHALAKRPVEPGREARFELERGVALTGRLVDARGAPVAGAYLTAVFGDGGKEEDFDVRETESGPDGRFELTALRSDLPHTLIVLADGFGKTLLDLPATDQPRDLEDLALGGGLRLEGRVLDTNGEPVAEQDVWLVGGNRDQDRLMPAEERLQAVSTRGEVTVEHSPSEFGSAEDRITDDLGRFRFLDLAPGDYTLQVPLPDGRAVWRRVALDAVDLTEIEVRVELGRTITIHVSSEGGDPVEGAWITCSALRIGLATDGEGTARLTLPADVPDTRLSVRAPAGAALLAAEGIPLIPTTGGEMRVTLGAGAIVAGTLLDPEGAPIDGGLIEMLAGESFHAVTTTQPDGSFSEVVPAGSTVMLVFNGSTTKGYRLLATDPITVPAESGALVLQARTVKLDRTLVVKAVDPEGNPIEGVGIVASPTVDDLRKVPKTGASGTVLLEGLPDARVRVSIIIEQPHAQTRHLAPPQPEWVTPQGQTLELRWKRPAPVSGVVLLPGGGPAAGVPVELLASGSGKIIANGFTDAEGRFELIVPEGEHESVELVIAPTDAGLRIARRPGIRPGTSGLSIRLEPLR